MTTMKREHVLHVQLHVHVAGLLDEHGVGARADAGLPARARHHRVGRRQPRRQLQQRARRLHHLRH